MEGGKAPICWREVYQYRVVHPNDRPTKSLKLGKSTEWLQISTGPKHGMPS